jgi:hypothetical protein
VVVLHSYAVAFIYVGVIRLNHHYLFEPVLVVGSSYSSSAIMPGRARVSMRAAEAGPALPQLCDLTEHVISSGG